MRIFLTILLSVVCLSAFAQGDNPQFKGFGLTRWDTTAVDVNNQRPPAAGTNAQFMYNWRSGQIQVKINGVWYNLAKGSVSQTIPNATSSTAGKAKLYTTTGSATDGAMDQNSTTNALNLKANINSQTFTGDPKAPTPTAGDNDTSIPTTSFVKTALDNYKALPLVTTQSTNHTFDFNDINRANGAGIVIANVAGVTYTVPANATTAFDNGTGILIDNQSAGIVTIAYAGGVTGTGFDIPSGSMATVFKEAINTWKNTQASGGSGGISNCFATYTNVTADHAVIASDFSTCNGQGILRFTGSGPYTVTVNTNATTPITTNYGLTLLNESADNVTVSFSVGVSYNAVSLVLGPKSAATLDKYATDSWNLVGTGSYLSMTSVAANEFPISDGANLVGSGFSRVSSSSSTLVMQATGGGSNVTTTFGGKGTGDIYLDNNGGSTSNVRLGGSSTGILFDQLNNRIYSLSSGGYRVGNPSSPGPFVNLGNDTQLNGGGLVMKIRSVTASTTLTSTDYYVEVNATSGSVTITLPTASSNTGRVFKIKRMDGSVNTINVSSGQNIDGSGTFALTLQYDFVEVASNGTTYSIWSQK